MFVLQAPIALAQEFYTTPEVLTLLFPKSEFVKPDKYTLTLPQQDHLKKILKSPEVKQDWTFYTATTKSRTDGYALIDQVRGKEKPFTYVVAFTPDGKVSGVEILLYRESHGSQIRNRAFRKQFTGKSSEDQLKLGQDIRNVSGATISARSITFGVKRATLVWNEIYKKN